MTTFSLLSGRPEGSHFAGWFISLLLGVFAIIFGARRLDASERHGGLVFAVAFESAIKLVAFLAVGIFVTYGLFNGFGDIFGRIQAGALCFAHEDRRRVPMSASWSGRRSRSSP